MLLGIQERKAGSIVWCIFLKISTFPSPTQTGTQTIWHWLSSNKGFGRSTLKWPGHILWILYSTFWCFALFGGQVNMNYNIPTFSILSVLCSVHKISERHQLLRETISTRQDENDSYDMVTYLNNCLTPIFLTALWLEILLFYIYINMVTTFISYHHILKIIKLY